jgi:hypothetical protein
VLVLPAVDRLEAVHQIELWLSSSARGCAHRGREGSKIPDELAQAATCLSEALEIGRRAEARGQEARRSGMFDGQFCSTYRCNLDPTAWSAYT